DDLDLAGYRWQPRRPIVVIVYLAEGDCSFRQDDLVRADAGLATPGRGVGVGSHDGVTERTVGAARATAETGDLDDAVRGRVGIGIGIGFRVRIRVGVRVGVRIRVRIGP